MSYDLNAATIASIASQRAERESVSNIAAQTATTESQQLANLQTTQDQEADQATAQIRSDIAAGKDIQGGARSDGPTTNSGMFNSIGAKLSSMGFTKRSLEAFKAGDDYSKTENTQANDELIRAQNRLENVNLEYGIIANHLASANANNWGQKVEELINNPVLGERTRQQLSGLPREFDQETLNAIQSEALNAKDRITFDTNQQKTAWMQDNANARLELAKRAQDRAEAAQQEVVRRNKLLEDGRDGKVAGAPSEMQVNMAKAMIVNEVYKGKDPDIGNDVNNKDAVLKAASYGIAARASAIMQEDKSLRGPDGYSQALSRAITDGQKSGELVAPVEGEDNWVDPDVEAKPAAYKPKPLGSTAKRQLPMPENDAGEFDPGLLKIDTWYTDQYGKPIKFLGYNKDKTPKWFEPKK